MDRIPGCSLGDGAGPLLLDGAGSAAATAESRDGRRTELQKRPVVSPPPGRIGHVIDAGRVAGLEDHAVAIDAAVVGDVGARAVRARRRTLRPSGMAGNLSAESPSQRPWVSDRARKDCPHNEPIIGSRPVTGCHF